MKWCFRDGLIAAALLVAGAGSARAGDIDLLSAETLELVGDVRLVAADGEESWVDGGFGKLRASGSGDGELRPKPELGTIDLVWQPRFGWALTATVVATLQGGEKAEAGLSEAYLQYKPMASGPVRLSARAGLMWPPVSLEHGGADWHVTHTITPSAINSWIGEEVRPLALEGTAAAELGGHRLDATLAVFAANDTSGTLIAFRGWALHDRKTLAFRRQPLPPLGPLEGYQPRFTHPLLDVGEGFAERPGYYAKLGWQPPLPVRVELFHYDNRADPEAVNEDVEWGWRTQFQNLGVIADLAPETQLKVQAMIGRTRMGFEQEGLIWVDSRFRSAFALLAHDIGLTRVAARLEAFEVEQKGSLAGELFEEDGWAAALAGRRELGRGLSAAVELLHVATDRPQRTIAGLPPEQDQTQVQAALRLSW